MPRGGFRPNSGRKKKDRSGQDYYEDAESYLIAVVQGIATPDPVRVQAAKTLISFQEPKKRTKPKSATPKELNKKAERSIEAANLLNFQEKADRVRAKYTKMEG